MLQWRRFLAFLIVFLSVMGAVHGYIYLRVVKDTALPSPWNLVAGVFFTAAILSLPLSFVAGRTLARNLARLLVVPAYLWLGFAFQVFFLLLAGDVIRALVWLTGTLLGVGPFPGFRDPSLTVHRLIALAAVAIALASTIFGIWWGLRRIAIRRIEVPLQGLPAEMDGFTIVQLSDLHMDLVHGRGWLTTVVNKTNSLAPDLVAITGDLAEGSVAQFGYDAEPLNLLSAPNGVFFVTGNHEYFHDLQGWLERLPQLGIRVLRNERVQVQRYGVGFDLAGVDDHDGKRMAPGHGPDLQKALEGRDRGRPVVLLAHQPRIMDEAVRWGVDLVLSGHTHGGQIWPFSYLVYLQQPYVKGLKRREGTVLYLSAGTGFWGPPMRLGTTAEIAVITLRSGQPSASGPSPELATTSSAGA